MRFVRTVTALVAAAGVTLALAEGSGASATAAAKTYSVRATMNTAQVVTPANKPWVAPASVRGARGSLVATLSTSAGASVLSWRVVYSGIGVAHLPIVDISLGRPGHWGQFLARLCAPCTSGQRGSKKLTTRAVRAMTSGDAWVMVRSERFGNGVIRGQISATPH